MPSIRTPELSLSVAVFPLWNEIFIDICIDPTLLAILKDLVVQPGLRLVGLRPLLDHMWIWLTRSNTDSFIFLQLLHSVLMLLLLGHAIQSWLESNDA